MRLSDYSETSQVATFVTDTAGKLAAIAKGSKRAKSPTGGALDLLSVYEIVFSPSRSGGLATLREAGMKEHFPGLRRSSAHFYAGLYLGEVSSLFAEGSEGTSEHFDLLVESLRHLARLEADEVPYIILFFESHVLEAAGLEPNLSSCARCGGDLPKRGAVRISLEDGGLLCGSCDGGVEVRPGSLAALRRVFESTPQSVRRLKLRADLLAEVSSLLSAALIYAGERLPRALKFAKPRAARSWRRWAPPREGEAAQSTERRGESRTGRSGASAGPRAGKRPRTHKRPARREDGG